MSFVNRRLSGLVVIVAIALSVAAQQADADLITDYGFLNSDATSADIEPNSTAGNFTIVNPSGLWGFSNSGDNVFTRSPQTAASEAGALGSGDYFSFTVTPDPGFEMDLTSLTFDTLHNATNTTPAEDPNATISFFVRSSVDSFAANIGSTFTEAWNTTTARSVSLSGPAFQNIQVATEFRLYVYDSGVDTLQGGRLDNVCLNGTVSSAVPEPSSFAMFAVVGLASLRRRRKRLF